MIIKLKNSSTGAPPTSLETGEVALSYLKGSEALFFKNTENEIITLNDYSHLINKPELHTHANFTYLDLIDQNLSKTSNPLFNSMNITTTISSPDFISGVTGKGWKIGLTDNKSYGEFDSLLVRGSFTASEFLLNQVRATNGSLVVSDSAKIESVSDNVITISGEDNNMMMFQTGDILKCQKFTGTSVKMYKLQVESITGLTFQFTILEGTAGLIKEGDTLVRWTSTTNDSRKGLVYLTSSDSYAPFIDTTYDGVTKARFGNLEGIIADGTALSGYGIYCDNGYFKGNVVITGGNAATKDYVLNNTAKHCGDWKADTAYIKSTIVTYNNCTWMAMNDVPANYKPDTEYTLTSLGRYLYSGDAQLAINTKNWELISERDYSKILGYTDYSDMLAKAEAGQTIISGGYINTSLINTSALIVNGGLATASDVTTALSPYLKSETIIEGGYIKTGLINVDTLFSNKSVSVSGVFTGSVATPFSTDYTTTLVEGTRYRATLSLTNKFNYKLDPATEGILDVHLPNNPELNGTECNLLCIINNNGTTVNIYADAGGGGDSTDYIFFYNVGGVMKTCSVINIGWAQRQILVRLKAIPLVNECIHWWIENPLECGLS